MKKRILIFAVLMLLGLSLFAQKEEQKGDFEINPNPMYRYTNIYLHNAQPMNVQIRVVDSKENLVKTIYSGPCKKMATFYWDRMAEDGTYVPNGFYTVIVDTDLRYTSVKRTLILK